MGVSEECSSHPDQRVGSESGGMSAVFPVPPDDSTKINASTRV